LQKDGRLQKDALENGVVDHLTSQPFNHARTAAESRPTLADPEIPKTAVQKPGVPSRRGAQALGGLVEKSLESTLKAKGFADSSIHQHWAEIAGAALAPWSEPVSLKWPPRVPGADPDRAKEGAVLTIKVEGAFALDMQHMAPQIISRINGFIGWRCVGRLALKQGPVRKEPKGDARRKPVLSAAASQTLDGMLGTMESGKLKEALARLGVAVMGTK
jgi:hypothetical protein